MNQSSVFSIETGQMIFNCESPKSGAGHDDDGGDDTGHKITFMNWTEDVVQKNANTLGKVG